MANETLVENLVIFDAFISGNIAPNFRARNVVQNGITVEELPAGSDSKKFVKRGGHTAYVVAEGAEATKSERTDTSVTLQVQKATVYYEPSIESIDFSRENELMIHAEEASKACLAKFEVDTLALADGFTASAGSTGVDLTPAVFREACYKASLGNDSSPLVAFLHNTQVYDLGDDVATSTALYHSRDVSLATAQNGTTLSLFDVPIFKTTNTESINTGADWAGLVCTKYAIASILNPNFRVMSTPDVSKGTIETAIHMYYQVGEWNDGSGCYIVSDQ